MSGRRISSNSDMACSRDSSDGKEFKNAVCAGQRQVSQLPRWRRSPIDVKQLTSAECLAGLEIKIEEHSVRDNWDMDNHPSTGLTSKNPRTPFGRGVGLGTSSHETTSKGEGSSGDVRSCLYASGVGKNLSWMAGVCFRQMSTRERSAIPITHHGSTLSGSMPCFLTM